MPTIENIPAGWFVTNGWIEVETTLVGVGAKITMGIDTDAPTAIYNNYGINVINANAPITIINGIPTVSTKTTASRSIVASVGTADITAGKINLIVYFQKIT